MIYADNAATTPLSRTAFDAMEPYLFSKYANASQPYAFARAAKQALAKARADIAECIGADAEEIYFTSGGTESDNWAIKGSAFAAGREKFVVTSQAEHHAVLNACRDLETLGYPVRYIHPDSFGVISTESIEKQLTVPVSLVSVMYANNEIGTICPIRELAQVAHAHGAIFHTDAVQAVGHVAMDVKALDVDLLSASAHKFHGPKGVGFLYVKTGTPLVQIISGGEQEMGMRAGTENLPGIVGMACALKESCDLLQQEEKQLYGLTDIVLTFLRENDVNFRQNGGKERTPGNLSLSFLGMDGEAILHRLDLMGICVSTGSACDGKNTQVSHVLQAIGLDRAYADGTIRITFGRDNTEEEAQKVAQALVRIIGSSPVTQI